MATKATRSQASSSAKGWLAAWYDLKNSTCAAGTHWSVISNSCVPD
jgi:hypothetical protein